jgi:putative addiction module component (TIGR02574 family)
MGSTAIKLLEDAMRLPDNDRADLAAKLIDSLDPQFEEGATEAWDAEIARRIAELDGGKVKTIPWSEARRIILGTSDGATDT